MPNPVYELLSIAIRGGVEPLKEIAKDGLRQAAGEIVQAIGITIAEKPKKPPQSEQEKPIDEEHSR
jgi:hypothetical protein